MKVCFNVLSNRGIFGTHVLDIFSGTGAVAIEALSRGAAHAVAVDFKTGKLILENAKHCHVEDRLEIIPRKLSQLKKLYNGTTVRLYFFLIHHMKMDLYKKP